MTRVASAGASLHLQHSNARYSFSLSDGIFLIAHFEGHVSRETRFVIAESAGRAILGKLRFGGQEAAHSDC